MRQRENQWAAATASHDLAAITKFVADDYMGITADGAIVTKAGLLAQLRRDKNSYDSVSNSRVDVRLHGNTAVVVGTTRHKGKDAAGKAFAYTYRWTDTWVERDGEWQCVSSQSVRQPG